MNAKINKIQSNTPLIGTIVTLNNPQITEMLSSAGFDWLMIDMEHSTLTIGEVQCLLQSMHPDCISIVRIPGNDPVWIKRVLETGCDGIMVPLVNSEDEARVAVDAAKYPSDGSRSFGVSRAHGYGARFDSYINSANQETVVLIQVEHIKAVNYIEQILSVKGIGGIFVGPYDLSGSLNRIGNISDEEVQKAIDIVKACC
ncbi:MAG: 2-dehydro-3-deoxyglucarate aldolase [Bacteroidetes bacterium]|nr:2-dehydro-3-deoxyglucarate aldolase [Bacteroidota bacterium]